MAWQEKNNALCKSYEFADFVEAFSFMTRIALVAEKLNHHPTMTNTWNRLDLSITTHDEGYKITEADRELAKAIDQLKSNALMPA